MKSGGENAQLDGYVYEALRLEPTFRGVFRMQFRRFQLECRNLHCTAGVSTKDQTIHGLNLKQGDRVFLNTASANFDVSDTAIGQIYHSLIAVIQQEKVFQDPTSFNATRSIQNRLFADGLFKSESLLS